MGTGRPGLRGGRGNHHSSSRGGPAEVRVPGRRTRRDRDQRAEKAQGRRGSRGDHEPAGPPPVTSPFGRLVIIANPASGRARSQAELRTIETALRDWGLDYRIVPTTGPGHAAEAAAAALRD